jgi:hypothetical protein
VIREKLDLLNRTFEKLQVLDERIIELVNQEDNDEQQDTEFRTVEEYVEQYLTAKAKGERFCDKHESSEHSRPASPDTSSTVGSTVTGNGHAKTYKLPKIGIRKFNGEFSEWLGFWAQFEKIDGDESLHDSDKFQYLVQSMMPGTRVERVVKSYPQSADNYKHALQALRDRFGDKVILTEVYVRQLLKLVVKNVKTPNTLSSMYDELEAHLRALNSLGVTQEMNAAFLYPLVESSLPEETIRVWQRSTVSGYGDDEEKPVSERLTALIKFLRAEVKGAERLSIVSQGFNDMKERVSRDPGRKNNGPPQQNYATAAGLFAGQKAVAGCIFCGKNHDSQRCGNAQSMSYSEKRNKIVGHNACLCCLKVGHVAKACKSYIQCIICSKRHASLMCPSLDANRKGVAGETKDACTENAPEVNSNLNCTNEVMFQTLRVVITNGTRSKEVRAIFDSGSQKSYILESIAR